MTTLAAIQLEYKLALQDSANQIEEITGGTDVRDKAIKEAVLWFTRRLPRVVTSEIANDVSGFYAVPADWTPRSRIISIEFPLDDNPPIYIRLGRGIVMQRRPSGIFYWVEPNPNGPFRLTYTAKYSGADSITEIDVQYDPIIGKLASAIAGEAFAAKMAKTVENNIDAVNYRTKEQEARAVAKSIREQVTREFRQDEWAQVYQTEGEAYGKGWRTQ